MSRKAPGRKGIKAVHPFRSFFDHSWSGGVILLLCVIIAMALANLPFTKETYLRILATNLGITVGGFSLELNLEKFVNDGLMVIFFFQVGLEIKRELLAGHLKSLRKASLPIAGALGGMIVPAIIYLTLNHSTITESGWGIPMATDIAFAIGILSLTGNRIPVSLKVFLTALAIADDLGAIIVIALFYGSELQIIHLLIASLIICASLLLNRLRVCSLLPYLLLGIALWFEIYFSGIHSTIAGVLLAFTIPSKPQYSRKMFPEHMRRLTYDFENAGQADLELLANEKQFMTLKSTMVLANGTACLSQKLESGLHGFVTFVVMPIFALANAGVDVATPADLNIFSSVMGTGIFLGLLIGKPLGISLFSWLAIHCHLADMPEGASWRKFISVACLGGIGFTMSIFIDTIAFTDSPALAGAGKIAVLLASVAAGILGTLLVYSNSNTEQASTSDTNIN